MNFSTKHQRKLISPLVSSILRGTTFGLSMTMFVFVPSILAQPDTGNRNNSTTPSALPSVSPSPGVNPSRPMDNRTLTPLFPPRPTPSVPMNDNLPAPSNDNNGIPGAEIDRMEDNNMSNPPNNQPNSLIGLPENERLPNSGNADHNSLANPTNSAINRDSPQSSEGEGRSTNNNGSARR